MNKLTIGSIFEIVFTIIMLILFLRFLSTLKSCFDDSEFNKESYNDSSKINDNSKTMTVPDEEIIYTSVIDILNEYSENEIAADFKYDGEVVAVTGVVYEVGKTEDFITKGTPYILFSSSGASNSFGTVQANFKNKNEIKKLANIEKGQQVSVKGVCNGESTFNIMLSDCYILEK